LDDAVTLSTLSTIRKYLAAIIIVPALVVAVIVGASVRTIIVSGFGRMNATSFNGHVAGSYTADDFADPDRAEAGQFERTVHNLIEQGVLNRVTLLAPDGTVVYSSEKPAAGARTLDRREQRALRGKVSASLGHRGAESELTYWAPVQLGKPPRTVGVMVGERAAGQIEISVRGAVLALAAMVVLGGLFAYALAWWLIRQAEKEIGRSQALTQKVNQRLAVSLASLERHSIGTLQALTQAVDAKDSYTAKHSVNVADYAAAVARRLGMEGEAVAIERAGLLHDIGKIGVPESLLLKASALTADEFRQVQEHSVMGARIIESMPFLRDAVIPVLYHHEHWDGSGYPDGLVGENIPRAARVLSVADAFDAMTTDRPYRGAMTVEQAVYQLRMGSGGQFDPACVDSLLALIEDGTISPS
jgi:putative nucleotidyltransferase with HDIG domain